MSNFPLKSPRASFACFLLLGYERDSGEFGRVCRISLMIMDYVILRNLPDRFRFCILAKFIRHTSLTLCIIALISSQASSSEKKDYVVVNIMNSPTLSTVMSKFYLKIWQYLKYIHPWEKMVNIYCIPFPIKENNV